MAYLTAVLGRIWGVVWRVVVFFVAWGALLAGFLIPFGPRLKLTEQVHSQGVQLYVEFAGAITIVAATWLATRFLDRRRFVTIGFAPRRLPRHLALGAAAGLGWIGISLAVALVGGWLVYRPGQVISWAALLGAGVALVLNVLTQQLLLCGYVFQTIRSRAGAPVAIVLAAAMFVGLHAPAFKGAWLPAVNVFLAGFLFCIAYQLSGELWFPIGMHAVWNYTLGPLLGLTVSGLQYLGGGWRVFDLVGPAWLTGGAFGLEGGLIVTATTCLMLVVVAATPRLGSIPVTSSQ
ncbi:MAG: CPBP family intramembrane glutamic endopeptidase [Thermoanaerobaculales bacterium]